MDCLFCAIVAGDIPSRHVYADDLAYAFLDINPLHDGHTLVISRRHVVDALADASALAEIAPAVQATAVLLKERLGADGINLMSSAGDVAGQEVFHLHVHVVPRFASAPGLPNLLRRDAYSDLDAVHARLIT